MLNALTTFRLFAAEPVTARQNVADRPEVAREISYYRENISSVKNLDDLMDDQRLYAFVMQAYGLEEMTYAKALVRRVIDEGTAAPDALANRLVDSRYLELASDFNFSQFGTATTTFERVQQGAIDKYVQMKLEVSAGDQNNGARLAMYFQRKLPEIETAYSILADGALLQFAKTALYLPDSLSFFDIDKQAVLISEKLNIEDLDDPEYVGNLITRFLASWDVANPQSVAVPPLVLGSQSFSGISDNLLMSIQNLRR